MKLLLLTANFPFPPGEQFLESELSTLAEHFEAVTVLPVLHERRRCDAAPRSVPPNVSVMHGFAPRSGPVAACTGLTYPLGLGRAGSFIAANLGWAHPATAWRAARMAAGLASSAASFDRHGLLSDHGA